MNKANNKGFTLVELIIAITITVIVGASFIVLLGYASNSTRITESKVALQSEAQTTMNHITSNLMAGSSTSISPNELVVNNNSDDVIGTPKEKVNYYMKNHSLYYGSPYVGFASGAAVDLNQYLLCEDVEKFECTEKVNPSTNRKSIEVVLELKNQDSTFQCKKEVYVRNQG